MAGIEPASERIDPRKSTSLVRVYSCELQEYERTRNSPAVRTRKPSFALLTAHSAALWLCDAYSTTGQRAGWADVTSRGGHCACPWLRQRGAEQRRKCVRHLIFCADFTRSAPLGLHFGTSLSRRSLASPIK